MRQLRLAAPEGIPEIHPGDRLDLVIAAALNREGLVPALHDAIVVSQKIVSKAEDRYVRLDTVEPGARAIDLSVICRKDPRFVELVLRQSAEVVRCAKDVLIVRHKLGFTVANAGIDQSNISEAGERVLLLPEDPDASAERLRAGLEARFGVPLAVVVADSFGRPWRQGVAGTCIGCAGIRPLIDRRGSPDRFGRVLRVTEIALADQIASAAALLTGEADEGRPVVLLSGLDPEFFEAPAGAGALVRPAALDLFGAETR